MKKRILATLLSLCLVLTLLPTVALAAGGYGENGLPDGPNMSGTVITVNTENAQYTLDGAYGSIDGKTIVFSTGDYSRLELGRATKYEGSHTDYYIGGVAQENKKTYEDFVAIKTSGKWSASAYYVRNMSNVTLKAAEGAEVNIAGLVASSGHVYGHVYDYVLDKQYESGSAYYLSQKLANITIEGIHFTAKVDFATSSEDTEIDGVTFRNCTFTTGDTASNNGQGLRYYNESNNGNVKNLTVDGCAFTNCYQGIYTQKINGVKVVNSRFDTTGHNAIAVQSGSEAINHKAVVITGNTFTKIGDRIIRFGVVGADTQITIQNNTATDSGDSDGKIMKAQSLAQGITYNICANNWGEGKAAENDELKEGTAVAEVNGLKYTTLAAAIDAAKNGDTVTLLKDVDLGSNTLTINKKITLDGGAEKHSITSTVGGAVVDINTSERVTIQNLKIFATASGKTGRGIGISNTSAKIDVNNVEIETTQRGITVNTDTNNGIELNLESCLISLVEPGQHASKYNYDTTVLPTNNYNNSRGISLWEMANSKVTLKNTTVQGFYYSINNSSNDAATKSEGLVVSAEGCTFKGRAAVNQHNAGVTYTLTNCNITGINNFGGEYEAFACIVMDNGARDNHVTVNGGTVRASFNDTGSSNINATQFLVADRVGNNTIELNNVTYICPTEYGDGKGGIVGEVSPGTEITVESGSYTMPEIIDTSYRNEAGEIGTLNILGGNFAYNTVSASIEDPDVQNALNISGGTFSSDPTDYVTDGKIAKKNSETEYAVIAKSGLTGGVYMSDPTDYTAANHYVTKNNDGTWTVFYVAPYVAPTYSITVDSAKHGDVTVSPRNASKGDKVTITVESDKGYTLETLTVTDKDGDEIELTNKGDGKYIFKMPASKVYVEATFMEDSSMLNFFVDVPADAYYYDAVLWAAENGITGGVDDTHFAPNATCTRAQAVTFLWRAAGSPAPKSSEMPFEDVAAGSYYYDAVLWAVENGVTKGTSDTTFSPDVTCSRGQIVTFLWRANGSPVASGNSAFTDVASDAYYAAAVTWAEKNGVTCGIGGGLFGSNNNCTRAQIVTFLWRALTE